MFVFEKVMFRLQSSNKRTNKKARTKSFMLRFLLYNAYYGAACVFSHYFAI